MQYRALYLSPQKNVAVVKMLIITLAMFINSMKYVIKWNVSYSNYNTKPHHFSSCFWENQNQFKGMDSFLVSRNNYNRRLEGKTDIHREKLKTPMISDW